MTDPRDPQARCQALAASLLWLFGQDQHLTYEDEESINPAYALAPGALSPPPEEMERRAALVVASAILGAGAYANPEGSADRDVPPLDLDTVVAACDFQPHIRRALRKLNATTLRQVIELTADQLLEAKNFGASSLHSLRTRLALMGLKLKGD